MQNCVLLLTMDNLESKIDQLLQDVAVVKTITTQHSTELLELKQKLEPVVVHVAGLKWTMKLIGSLIGLAATAIGAATLLK